DLWRRLGVIATEDVGLGSPYVTAAVSLLIVDKAFRRELGEEKCLCWIFEQMCAAPKERSLCDITVWAHLPGAVDEPLKAYSQLTPAHLVRIASDHKASFKDRLIAHWLMFGNSYRLGDKPTNPCPIEVIGEFYEEIGLPPLLRVLC